MLIGNIIQKIRRLCQEEFRITPEIHVDDYQLTVYLKKKDKTFAIRIEFQPECTNEICELMIEQVIDGFRNRFREME